MSYVLTMPRARRYASDDLAQEILGRITRAALVMLGLSIAYVLLGATPLAAALFLGVKSAVLAIVVEAVLRVGRRALKTKAAVLIAVAAFLALYVLRVPFPLVILRPSLGGED